MNYNTVSWKIIRWVGIIPCSVVGYLLARAIFNIMIHFSWDDEYPFVMNYIVPLAITAFGGYYGMAIGIYIAPNQRNYVALGLLILYTMICGAVIVVYCFGYILSIGSLLEAIGQLAGCIIAYIKFSQNEELF